MRNFLFLLVVLYSLSVCAVTVTMRGGRGTIEGELVETNDTHVVISTEEGKKEIPWPHVTRKSLIELHPALYKELLEKAKARQAEKEAEMREKGMVKVKGKWRTSEELLENIRLNVRFKEKKGRYEKIRDSDKYEKEERKVTGKCVIELDRLNKDVTYKVEIECRQWVEISGVHFSSELKSYTHRMHGVYEKEIVLDGKVYRESKTKEKLVSDIDRYGNPQYKIVKNRSKDKSVGWDVKIKINDHLVYTCTKAGEEKYTLVQSR